MTTLKIEGMKCMHCVGTVKKTLETVDGLSDVAVDLENGEVRFQGEADLDELTRLIAEKGFRVVDQG